MPLYQLQTNEIETSVSLEIYHTILDKFNSTPQLSVESLMFQYYTHIEFVVIPLFEFWLQKETIVYADEQEKNLLLAENLQTYAIILTEIIRHVWTTMNMTFVDPATIRGAYYSIENSPLQEVW